MLLWNGLQSNSKYKWDITLPWLLWRFLRTVKHPSSHLLKARTLVRTAQTEYVTHWILFSLHNNKVLDTWDGHWTAKINGEVPWESLRTRSSACYYWTGLRSQCIRRFESRQRLCSLVSGRVLNHKILVIAKLWRKSSIVLFEKCSVHILTCSQ